MLHSQVKAKSQRSIHTILDNTSVIDSFDTRSDTVQVRRMLSRTHKDSQHFIVTLLSDIKRAEDTTVVKPFAEVAIRGEKLRITVKPTNQYPHLRDSESVLQKIQRSVAKFMENAYSAHINFSDNQIKDSSKEWHLL